MLALAFVNNVVSEVSATISRWFEVQLAALQVVVKQLLSVDIGLQKEVSSGVPGNTGQRITGMKHRQVAEVLQ